MSTHSPSALPSIWTRLRGTRAWCALTPGMILATGAIIGLIAAVILWNTLMPLLKWLASVLDWIVLKLKIVFTDFSSPPNASAYKNVGLGVGAFGAVVVFSTIKETQAAVSTLIRNWMNANSDMLWSAFGSVVMGFAALGLSVYGIGELGSKPPPLTVAFDSASLPPTLVNPETGAITFLVSFKDEGGRDSIVNAQHESVMLRTSDTDFLQRLAAGLRKCRSGTSVPKVRIRGFASSTFWTAAAHELNELARISPVDPRVQLALAETNSYAASDPIYNDNAPLAVARAFNVYLANKRRAAVVDAMGANLPGMELVEEGHWANFADMEQALAIEDRGLTGQAAAAGILTRAVAVTIVDAAGCTRAPQVARVELSASAE